MSLRDGCAVVTGGASGNGRAIAHSVAEAGADVVVADRRREPREGGVPTHEQIRTDPTLDVEAAFVDCDVTDIEALAKAIEAADAFGGVTTLVNNAGVLDPGPFGEVTPEAYDRTMTVNARAPFFAAQFAAEPMVENGCGAIVNVASVAAARGMAGGAVYGASKGALRALTYALAAELSPSGVRVNAVLPGYVETAMFREDVPGAVDGRETLREAIPNRRLGEPADVAEAVTFLASERAEYVNGVALPVDGGLANTI